MSIGSHQLDIAIIGGGVIGLVCARQLAKEGLRVALFERDECGSGASKASLGALWPAPADHPGPLQAMQRASLWRFEPFAEALFEESGIDPGFLRCGRLEWLSSEKALQRAIQQTQQACAEWPSFGAGPVQQLISPEKALEIEPSLSSQPYGAVLCNATARVTPSRLTAALKQSCLEAGATIYEHCPVASLQFRNDKVTSILTAKRQFHPRSVLVTSGPWTNLLDQTVNRLAPVTPVKGQALRVSGDERFCQRIIKRGPIYIVPQGEHDAFIGATTEPQEHFDQTVTLSKLTQLIQGAIDIMPRLDEAVFHEAWAGLRPQGKDKQPFMGKADCCANLFFATGHFKIGIGMAPLVGEVMSQYILGRNTEWDLSPFKPGRFEPPNAG